MPFGDSRHKKIHIAKNEPEPDSFNCDRVGEGGSDLGGVDRGEGNRVGGACSGEGGACGKKTAGWTGDTGEGEHSATGGEASAGGATVCDDKDVARHMIGSDRGDSTGGVTGVGGAF